MRLRIQDPLGSRAYSPIARVSHNIPVKGRLLVTEYNLNPSYATVKLTLSEHYCPAHWTSQLTTALDSWIRPWSFAGSASTVYSRSRALLAFSKHCWTKTTFQSPVTISMTNHKVNGPPV